MDLVAFCVRSFSEIAGAFQNLGQKPLTQEAMREVTAMPRSKRRVSTSSSSAAAAAAAALSSSSSSSSSAS